MQCDLPGLGLRTYICGATGTGKSNAARVLVKRAPHRRIIVCDPTIDWSRHYGVEPITKLADLAAHFRKRRPVRLVIYQPPKGRYAEAAAAVAQMAMQAQEPVFQGRSPHRLLLVFDEASGAMPSRGSLNPEIMAMVERGRHYGIDAMALTQRPSKVHADFRGNSELRLYLPVYDGTDLKAISQELGADAKRIPSLPRFHALVWQHGQTSVMALPVA